MKYAELFKPHYDKRKAIVNSEYEPTKEEVKWVEPGESTEDEEKEEKEKDEDEKMAESLINQLKLDDNTKGIPEFWLQAMRNVELLEDMIKEVMKTTFLLLGLASSPYETSAVSLSVSLSVAKALIFPTVRFL